MYEPNKHLTQAAREALESFDSVDILDAIASDFAEREAFCHKERQPARAADYRAAAETIRAARRIITNA
jgi:hypothetical protein